MVVSVTQKTVACKCRDKNKLVAVSERYNGLEIN